MLAQQIVSGLATGSLYALTAIGIVLIFRNTRTINLAQGDFSMIGAFVALVVLERFKGNLLVGTLVAIVAVTLLAVAVQRLIMRPIEQADWLTLFTATLGVFYILHGVAGWIWGRDTKSFPALFSSAPVSVGGTLISQAHLFNMAVAAAVGGALFLFFRFTKPGIAMRAITEDPVAAQLMGIPVRSIVMLTWAVGGVLAAISGILLAPLVYVSTQMMDGVLVKGYVGAVFGGLYSLPGAVIGSLIIGVAENLAGGYLGAQYKVTIAFVLIVLVLALKPRGLFGGKARREI
jgi:branched-chain amino acid transport system permease protein